MIWTTAFLFSLLTLISFWPGMTVTPSLAPQIVLWGEYADISPCCCHPIGCSGTQWSCVCCSTAWCGWHSASTTQPHPAQNVATAPRARVHLGARPCGAATCISLRSRRISQMTHGTSTSTTTCWPASLPMPFRIFPCWPNSIFPTTSWRCLSLGHSEALPPRCCFWICPPTSWWRWTPKLWKVWGLDPIWQEIRGTVTAGYRQHSHASIWNLCLSQASFVKHQNPRTRVPKVCPFCWPKTWTYVWCLKRPQTWPC